MPLPCRALEPRLDHLPARRVDHHRHPGDVRLGRDEVEEADHVRLRVEQALVHVDVDRLGAVVHLASRYAERALEVVVPDEAREARRAGDVRALADVDEERVRGVVEGLEAGEAGRARARGRGPGRDAGDRLGKRPDVVRGSCRSIRPRG